MITLPEAFVNRMKNELPSKDWKAFFAVYQSAEFYKGVRANVLKCDKTTFENIAPFAISPIPWEENGYYVDEEKVGGHPYHFAGVYYSQEPSAMCAAPLLGVKKGEKVLDLCSAPGGKGTQLAAAMQGEGVLVLNEPIFSRAKILSQNAERLGVKNAIVTCAYPKDLAAAFPAYFDKILVDAPCSGEGMFRKNAKEAIAEWSEENVALCAARQKEILSFAAKMLKKGGRVVYSTCTFSRAEDEGLIAEFLRDNPQFRLLKQEKLYPHKVKGEGHFAALLEKTDGEDETVRAKKPKVDKSSEKAFRDFEKSLLNGVRFENITEENGVLYALPEDAPDWKNLQVLRAGVRLGEVKNGRFEPDHSLAMALKITEVKESVDFTLTDERTEKFLRGETVELDETVKNGWKLVCVDGFSVGFGKNVNGTLKNHIPKGLRKVNNG
ncbi:MAG: RsmF rRNA methyltransferase first C-terminal domain-containing protein [Clostridia bacterium]|nr:RsmF rRNA methyltransferase first C-terminal domain-containing protein [Clostridia bacterium]